MWTRKEIEEAIVRADLCESVTLPRDQYIELLRTAHTALSTATQVNAMDRQMERLVLVMPAVWNAITPADRQFMTAMMHGLLTARAKYPGSDNRYVAFTGEAGETMDAWAKMIYERCSVIDVASELRQVAQMACRLAVEGDSSLPLHLQTQFPCIVWPSSERS